MKNSLWVIFVVVSGFLGFLIGYSVSSYTGIQKVHQGYVAVAEAGGYGGESGGYGAESAGDRAAVVGSKEEGEDYGERTGYFGGK
jgi:hypothetical protein